MKDRHSLKADAVRFAVAAVFAIMTMAFLTVPYALTAHPGEAPVAATAARHLS